MEKFPRMLIDRRKSALVEENEQKHDLKAYSGLILNV